MSRRAEKALRDQRADAHAFNKALGGRVAAARNAVKMPVEKAAALLHRSVTQIYRYESGATTIEPFILDQMAKLYSCRVGVGFFAEEEA